MRITGFGFFQFYRYGRYFVLLFKNDLSFFDLVKGNTNSFSGKENQDEKVASLGNIEIGNIRTCQFDDYHYLNLESNNV